MAYQNSETCKAWTRWAAIPCQGKEADSGLKTEVNSVVWNSAKGLSTHIRAGLKMDVDNRTGAEEVRVY